MEGLPRKREHLRTFFNRHAPPEDGQHLPQGPLGEADSNINTLDSALLMAKLTIQLSAKQKRGQPTGRTKKQRVK